MAILVGLVSLALIFSTVECQNVASGGFGLITDGGSYTSYLLSRANGEETISLWSPNNGACSSDYTVRYDDDDSSSITVNDDCTFVLKANDIVKEGLKRKIKVVGTTAATTFTFEVKLCLVEPICIMVIGGVLMVACIGLAIAVRCYRHNVERKLVLVLMLVYALCVGLSLALTCTGMGLYYHMGFVRGIGISSIIQICIQVGIDIFIYVYYRVLKKGNKCGDSSGNKCGSSSNKCGSTSGTAAPQTGSEEKVPPPPQYLANYQTTY